MQIPCIKTITNNNNAVHLPFLQMADLIAARPLCHGCSLRPELPARACRAVRKCAMTRDTTGVGKIQCLIWSRGANDIKLVLSNYTRHLAL